MKKIIALFVLATMMLSCVGGASSNQGSNREEVATEAKAKYIFYFIGDGMAASQVRLAEAALSVPAFQQNYAEKMGVSTMKSSLNISALGVTGLATSNSANRYITDSAAAGTALAVGEKTNVGVISQTPSGERLKTVAEMAKDNGMKVGIVSSVSIDHATPACFYAHTASRNSYAEISDQMLTSGFDYFAGGSVQWNQRATRDGGDNISAYKAYKKEAEELGYKMISTKAEFDSVSAADSVAVIATLNSLANEERLGNGSAMPYAMDLKSNMSEDNRITLAQFTQKGIDLLDNPNGFFMMVEGGKIDWACHANDAATCAYEVAAFDDAIGVAMAFAEKHPDETLIVVTGDHDCGGLTIGFAGTGYESAFEMLAHSNLSHSAFTSRAVNKMKSGESFNKLLDFACESFGFVNEVNDGSEGIFNSTPELSDCEIDLLKEAYKKSLKWIKQSKVDDRDIYFATYGGKDPFTVVSTKILNNKAGVDFSSFAHTAVPVMVFADGACEDLFSGYYDNTDIAKSIIKAAGF